MRGGPAAEVHDGDAQLPVAHRWKESALTSTRGRVLDIEALLGADAESLLDYRSPTGIAELLTTPGPSYVDRVLGASDRSPRVLVAFERMLGHGRLGGTGYLSILPVDQGIEHSAGASFANSPRGFCMRRPNASIFDSRSRMAAATFSSRVLRSSLSTKRRIAVRATSEMMFPRASRNSS